MFLPLAVDIGRESGKCVWNFLFLAGLLVVRIFQKRLTERIAVFDLLGGLSHPLLPLATDFFIEIIS